MKELVFVDTETTGLDCSCDDLVELSYATLDSEIKTLYFGVTKVPEFIDNLTKFTERGVHLQPRSSLEEATEFIEILRGNTMVAANAAFDQGFMKKHELFTAHYRMLEIESFAMAKLGLDYVPSMFEIVKMLEDRGFVLTQPDHSSYNDVAAMRQAYKILRYI